jgi:adenylate kinase
VRILLIGPPGSGKGTQATRIGEHYGIAHISSGDLLRRHVEQRTDIGRTVKEYLDRGDLAPDTLVMDVLRKPVEQASRQGGYVLDGFPRTLAQAQAAYEVAREIGAWVQIAVHLHVPHDVLVERILARGLKSGRSDDNAEVVNHRVALFDEATPPMLDYYARREILLTVDGSRSIDEVTAAAIAELERVRPRLG